MMEQHLVKFLDEKINPEKDVITQASESQSRLYSILTSKLSAGEKLPDILDNHGFLFGSAVRGTQPKPFDDIDLMLVLDGSNLVAKQDNQVVGQAVGSGKAYNTVLSPYYLDHEGLISSQKILNRIREVLDETYRRSEIRKDGQAINVWMDSYGFGIDVVPAFKITGHAAGDHYYIPAGTGSDRWQSTNPLVDLQTYEIGDVHHKGLLRKTARLMRKWNELYNGSRLSGFHIDALVHSALLGKQMESIQLAILTCLQSFQTQLTSFCPQFSGFTPHIDHKLSDENRRLSIAASERAFKKIYSAIQVGDPYTIKTAWNEVFGDKLL